MAWVALYAASIVAANILISVLGVIPIGFGLTDADTRRAADTLSIR